MRKLLLEKRLQRRSLETDSCNTKLSQFQSWITLQELNEAEMAIIKCVQLQTFGKEIRAINTVTSLERNDRRNQEKRKKSEIKKTSSIYELNPFLSEGILRVGGRLAKANLPEETKHPFILPHKRHFTTLIICHVHRSLGHAARGHVLATLREKYRIVSANSAVRHLLYHQPNRKWLISLKKESTRASIILAHS